ncbi:MAG: hypothetical protein M1840_008717 [Geoglossum simile]|nr:MAG: hypothetical protein M1840_008717 [Geoglossum simile]
MKSAAASGHFKCTRYLRVHVNLPLRLRKTISSVSRSAPAKSQHARSDGDSDASREQSGASREGDVEASVEQGAMSRRLAEMTEQSLEGSTRQAQKTVGEAGFSEKLKQQLEERLLDARFREDNVTAFAQVDLPASANRATRDLAAAEPWTGTEQDQDAVLRMLVDAHKPLKGSQSTQPRPAIEIKVGHRRPPSGQRLTDARDRSSTYSLTKDSSLSEKERTQMKQELKDRFLPGARTMPATLQGLASLANEKIEDAISRGQFKNLPRGKPLERDYNASSPFLNTTEYFMNKIIQKQNIVPPWIEKQQELTRAIAVFRSRLRNDWKRHAAGVISSTGGSLHEQIRRTEGYAAAERRDVSNQPPAPRLERESVESLAISDQDGSNDSELQESEHALPPPLPPTLFRDPAWERTENAYHALTIQTLNDLTRTYNLLAPTLAKKPYFSLDRELRSCFFDVAPQLADEIRERAKSPGKLVAHGKDIDGFAERFAAFSGGGARETVKVVSERSSPHYGFREMVRDWRKGWGR